METKQLIDSYWYNFTRSAKSCRKCGDMWGSQFLTTWENPESGRHTDLSGWKMSIRHKSSIRSGDASTGRWLFFSKNKQTRAGECSAFRQVLAPDGPWLITMASSKGKHAGSNSWALSQQICIYWKNYDSRAGPSCDRMCGLTAP